MKESKLDIFCRQIRSRSEENRKAIQLLFTNRLFANIVSILRQELDSMIRVIFLLSIEDQDFRNYLIETSVDGKKWTDNTGKRVTDRDMVELSNKLNGWTKSVYKFGCAFIHLSSFHDYLARDPMNAITSEEKKDMILHLRYYHGGPLNDDPKFDEIVDFFPMVFDKISSNLECYIKMLENGEKLEDL